MPEERTSKRTSQRSRASELSEPALVRAVKTHPWLTFRLDLRDVKSHRLWMLLGEAQSKCEHIAGVPLMPEVARKLHEVYLVKGVRATTAIEGNTLSEDEVRRRIQGRLHLPASREYLGQEVDNVVRALKLIHDRAIDSDGRLSVAELVDYNAMVLQGLELEEGVIPGMIRTHNVGVARYAAPEWQLCQPLMEKLCTWLNEPSFREPAADRVGFGILRAVMAHLYLAWIHPFGDGNGRTARLAEFRILIDAGVPTPAAHLLSNHYNQTRAEYYRQLDRASASKGDVEPFLLYALQGFVDGLLEQLAEIQAQQLSIAWRDYLHEMLPDSAGPAEIRRRHLVIDVTLAARTVPIPDLDSVSARVAREYASLTQKTLGRDLEDLVNRGFLRRDENGVIANTAQIRQFIPVRKHKARDEEQPPLFEAE